MNLTELFSSTNLSLFSMIAQILLGLLFFVFGLNGFFHWMPIPKGSDAFEKAMNHLMSAGSLMTAVKIFEVIAGFSLIVGAFLQIQMLLIFGFILLQPIIFVIAYMQLTLNFKNGFTITSLILVLNLLSITQIFLALLSK
jgi:putative oxidoreductase